MKKLTMGIIGLGAIGQRLIKVIKDHENFTITGVYDVDPQVTNHVADTYNLKALSSLDDMINDPELQAIYLAVPPKYHADLALKVLKANKHLLCEKPLAGTIEEAKIMADQAEASPVVTAMNFPMPYTAAYHEVTKRLGNQDLGKLLRIDVKGVFPDWPRKWQVNKWIDTRQEGGFVREVFTHFIQMIISWYGPVQGIQSMATYQDPKASEKAVIGWGQLTSGVPVTFSGLTHVAQPEHLAVVLYGDKATLEIVNWRDLYITGLEIPRHQEDLPAIDATKALLDAFYANTQGTSAPLVNFKTGYETVKVVEQLLNNGTLNDKY